MVFEAPPNASRDQDAPRTLADLTSAMLAFGLQFQGQPVVDGKIHRVPGPSSKNKKDLAAWYSATLYDSGLIYATFGDWHHQDRWGEMVIKRR